MIEMPFELGTYFITITECVIGFKKAIEQYQDSEMSNLIHYPLCNRFAVEEQVCYQNKGCPMRHLTKPGSLILGCHS